MKTTKQLLSQIKKSAMFIDKNYQHTGSRRKPEIDRFMRFVVGISQHYAKKLNISQQEVLYLWEKNRTYWALNYYQQANFPKITAKDVYFFNSSNDFHKRFPSRQYICPACNSISTNMMICNSGKEIDGKVCDWKSFGLFGCLGKGITVILKDNLKPIQIFKPIELIKDKYNVHE